jgi:hypothetical protein
MSYLNCLEVQNAGGNGGAYVTITAFFARTHKKITWDGTIPRFLAILCNVGSRGPPGYVVIGLQ